jgi:methylated-DNA-[protein]-cysteine S-methyltransferase
MGLYVYHTTPLGHAYITETDGLISGISITNEVTDSEQHLDARNNAILNDACQQLDEYFAGKRLVFDFPVKQCGTAFQQEVWTELLNIPFGQTISYSQLSNRMKNPLAIRAIASANGKNNLWIVVPCHRVIGANGSLTGYAGGLWRKQWLLEHETKVLGVGQAKLF